MRCLLVIITTRFRVYFFMSSKGNLSPKFFPRLEWSSKIIDYSEIRKVELGNLTKRRQLRRQWVFLR